jgi:hypothetical protein
MAPIMGKKEKVKCVKCGRYLDSPSSYGVVCRVCYEQLIENEVEERKEKRREDSFYRDKFEFEQKNNEEYPYVL